MLISAMHRQYELSIALVPEDNFYGQFALMGHSGFLAAASLIGQAQPYEAMPITRRAIEMVRVAAAVKENPDNSKEWMAFKQRHERWLARQTDEKPKPLKINLKVDHPIVNELMTGYGILSDAAVHFTPEYFASLSWQKRPGMLFLDYFIGDQRTIEREIILLVGTHAKILTILDDCLDSGFSKNGEWVRFMAALEEKGKLYAAKFHQPDNKSAGGQAAGSATPLLKDKSLQSEARPGPQAI